HPRLVGVVVVEEPQGGKYYAAQVTAPLFSRIMSRALGILRVAPEDQRLPSTVLASLPARYPEGLVPASSRRESPAPAAGPSQGERPGSGIPDASGLTARQALALFARAGIVVRLQGAGFVASQTPAPGTALRPGEIPTLVLSESAPSVARSGGAREETSSSPFRP
ncbi:MAG TPA: PASTA domain-containing protein, partial [Thermoanaerobaculia bacterium]